MLGNCCDDTCTYVREKFNRANETPIASPWEKLLGNTWNLRDKLLDGLNTGTYRYNFAFPGAATDARHASVRFKINSAGTTELLLAIAEDSFLGQPYDWFTAFVEYKSTGCSFLGANSFYHGAGYGALPGPSITNRVQCPSLTLNEWHRLEGCLIPNAGSYGYDGYNLIIAKLTCADGTIYSCQELSNTGQTLGAHGGLKFNRSGSIGSVEFDDYEETYYRNSPSGQHRTCPWCRTPCLISQDDFSIDRPCLWDLTAGSVTRGGGVMTVTSNNTAVQHHIFHPGLKTTGKVTATWYDDGVKTVLYGTNGYAELTLAGTTYTLTLKDRSGSTLDSATFTYTSPATSDPTKELRGVICYSLGILAVSVTGHDGLSVCVETAIDPVDSAYWVGLGGDAGVRFTSFRFDKTYETTEPSDKDCNQCDTCVQTNPCAECFDNKAPRYMAIKIPTDLNGTCTTCDVLAGTYIGFPIPPDLCDWTATIPLTALCGLGTTSGTIIVTVTGTIITVNLAVPVFGGLSITWEKTFTGKPHCAEFVQEPIPLKATDFGTLCVSGGNPVLLTAI